MSHLHAVRVDQEWRYIEVRPVQQNFGDAARKLGFSAGAKYLLHRVNLEPTPEEIFRRVDKNSVQRRVRRGEREGVLEARGNSEDLLSEIYRRAVRTRPSHTLPPQPYVCFRHRLRCL